MSNKYHLFIISLVTLVFTCIFDKQQNGHNFFTKKCLKCGTVASYIYFFIEQISRTTYHRNLIDPYLENRKFPTYCDYILQIVITTPSLVTASFFAISIKN